jgi:hypothetical protein
MHLFKRQKTGSGFSIVPRNGNFSRLVRGKTAGYGIGEEVFKNDLGMNKPLKTLTQKMNHISIKSSKPRKYISLNL